MGESSSPLEERVRELERRLAEANLRSLNLILYMQALIAGNKLREDVTFDTDKGRTLTQALDSIWDEAYEDLEHGR